MRSDVGDTARRIQSEAPIPETFSELDTDSQRVLARKADRLGVTPEAYYATIVAEHKAAAAFDPDAVAREVRRYR